MRFVIQVLLIVTGGFLAESIFPWWTIAVIAFMVCALLPASGFRSFLAGFMGTGLLWLAGALFYSISTDFILTEKVAKLMQLGSPGSLIVITALVGGLVGGLGALSGSQLYQLLKLRRTRKSRYTTSFRD